MIRALTLDAHGTLIVPHPGVGAVYARVAGRFGVDCGADVLDAAFPSAFARVRAGWGVPYGADEADARRFWDAVVAATFAVPVPPELCSALYDAFAGPDCWRVLPGVREALATAGRAGLPMAVVSNFDLRLPGILAGLGLGPFVAVVVSSRVGRAKPDPGPLRAAATGLGIPVADLLHVGDSASEDGGAAAAAGCAWLRVDPATGLTAAALAPWLA